MSGRLAKAEVRQRVRAQRRTMDPVWRAHESAQVQARVLALSVVQMASVVGVYMALPGEVDMTDLCAELMRTGREVCVPCFDRERGAYAMACVNDATQYVAAALGVREPECPQWVGMDALDCILVPGVAFDLSCRRVGHGGGHYDRMLATTEGVKIGVAFDFQLFEAVAGEGHDIAMDAVVTPSRVIDPANAIEI